MSKPSLPAHVLKFAVDDHGVIVPMLRLEKGGLVRRELLLRALQPRWKAFDRSR